MLAVRRDQVDIEVISEGSRGVLGFGAENARVRLVVTLPPAPVQPPTPPPAARVEPESKAIGRAPAPREEPKSRAISRKPVSSEEPAAKSVGRALAPREELKSVRPAPAPTQEPGPEAHSPGADEAGREVLNDLLGLMGIHATIETQPGDDLADEGQPAPVVLNLTGDDLGILIGRRGETLRALQYLVRLMVSHRLKHWTNLVVDVENYRVRRRHALESLAQRVAEEVTRSGRSQALEPMPPDERRVVHITLRNHPKVATQSVGEGERRKVTIILRR